MEKNWNQWLGGLIDGCGDLLKINNKISCEITLDIKDEHALNQIKNKLGGSIKLRSKSIRYRLHDKKGIYSLITRINGEIRTISKKTQLIKICNILNIPYIEPDKLTSSNSWISGMFDAKGSVTGVFAPAIMIAGNDKINLLSIVDVFGGDVVYDISSDTYNWCLLYKVHINIFLEYIKSNPIRTIKKNKLFLIPEFYSLSEIEYFNNNKNSLQYKAWLKFKAKWNHI